MIDIETKAAQGQLEDFPAPAGSEAQTEMETASQKEIMKAQPKGKAA